MTTGKHSLIHIISFLSILILCSNTWAEAPLDEDTRAAHELSLPLKGEGLRKSFFGWIHKGLSAYDEKLIKERKARIDAMVNDLSAEAVAIGKAHAGYQKALRELELAERVMAKIKAALEALNGCLVNAKCDIVSLGFRRPFIPDFTEAKADGSLIDRWGYALRELKKLVKDQADLIETPSLQDDCTETGVYLGDKTQTHILISTDASEWCRYRPETLTPIPVPLEEDKPVIVPIPVPTENKDNPSQPTPGTPTSPSTTPEQPNGQPTGETVTVTPDNNDTQQPVSTPRDKEKTPKDTPKEIPIIYINVKASSTAVAKGAKAIAISGQQIKFFPVATADPALPGTSPKDTETGAASDPAQGITNEQGKANIALNPTDFAIAPNESKNFIVGLNLDPSMTSVISPEGTPVAGINTPAEQVSVNGKGYWVFYLPNNLNP